MKSILGVIALALAYIGGVFIGKEIYTYLSWAMMFLSGIIIGFITKK